jgi:hypothetical protein
MWPKHLGYLFDFLLKVKKCRIGESSSNLVTLASSSALNFLKNGKWGS